MLTSVADRTSPVLRGKWVMEVLLGIAAAAAAAERAGARRDQGDATDGQLLTTRERMEEHRKNPACSSCHRVIDPIGLALENFDVDRRVAHQGQRRRRSTPPATLYDGTPIDGPAELRQALLKRPDVVRPDASPRT